jgi:hypothetical protein
MADVDRFADVKAGDVDFDVIGDVRGVADQLQFVTDDVQNTAALQAGRFFFVDGTSTRTVASLARR